MEKLWDKDIKRLVELKRQGILNEDHFVEMEEYYLVSRDDIITCLTVEEMKNEVVGSN